MEETIHVGVVVSQRVALGAALATLFALRTDDVQVRDYKYVVWDALGILLLSTHPLNLSSGSAEVLYGTVPSGTCRTLYDGTKVTVWQEEL